MSSGDMVFLSFEYFLDDGDFRLKKEASSFFPEAANYYNSNEPYSLVNLRLEDTRANLKNMIRRFINKKGGGAKDPVYSMNGFNEYGDIVSHFDKKKPAVLLGKGKIKYKYWDAIKEINEFYEFASNINVSVYYLFPTLVRSEYDKSKDAIELLRKDLDRDLEIEIINEPESFVFHDSLFFDTVYHLTKRGREKRTTKMIEILQLNSNVQQEFKVNSNRELK